MDINSILQGINCSCGRTHFCDIENIYIENNATARLSVLCEKYKSILLVADENTFKAAGDKVLTVLNGKSLKRVIFDGEALLIPNEKAIEAVYESIDKTDLIIGIGSGVIQDLCKYVSHFKEIPYMIVATAPSMDGYASDGAAMILKGMKETVKAGLPRAIIADTEVLRNAPLDMIKAGYGDIIGKFSALCDWELSRIVNGEYFCQYIFDTTYKMIENTIKTAEGLLKRDENSVKALMEALAVVGIMMSFAGSSRPASGSEHHLSHFFEIVGIVNNEPYLPHGTDVAYSTVVTTKIREKIAESDFPNTLFRLSENDYKQKMNEIYKSVANGCMSLQEKIGNYTALRFEIYHQKQAEIKELFKKYPDAKEIERILKLAELDMSEFFEIYTKEKIHNAIAYAKDLKDRYTVLWLYYDLFGDENAII